MQYILHSKDTYWQNKKKNDSTIYFYKSHTLNSKTQINQKKESKNI